MMMPRRLLHSAHIAVGVLAMLVVALSSDLSAFQKSDPHPVDGKKKAQRTALQHSRFDVTTWRSTSTLASRNKTGTTNRTGWWSSAFSGKWSPDFRGCDENCSPDYCEMMCLSLPWCIKYSISADYAACQFYERLDGFAGNVFGSSKVRRIYDKDTSNPIPEYDWLAPKPQLPKTWSCALNGELTSCALNASISLSKLDYFSPNAGLQCSDVGYDIITDAKECGTACQDLYSKPYDQTHGWGKSVPAGCFRNGAQNCKLNSVFTEVSSLYDYPFQARAVCKASTTPKVSANAIRRYAHQQTTISQSPDPKCFAVVPYKSKIQGEPKFNTCGSCDFDDGRVDIYGCAYCSNANHVPLKPNSIFSNGTISCGGPSLAAILPKCMPTFSTGQASLIPNVHGTKQAEFADCDTGKCKNRGKSPLNVPARWAQMSAGLVQTPLTCFNLGITLVPMQSGNWNRYTLVNIGCRFWKAVSCVGVWSGQRWNYKCTVSKKCTWVYVDTCAGPRAGDGRSSGFDWEDSSTHGSSTCNGGTYAFNGISRRISRSRTPTVITTYDALKNYRKGRDHGVHFYRLADELSNGLCGNTILNK